MTEDLGQVARVLVDLVGRLRHRSGDVAQVVGGDPELLLQMLGELRVADRGRAHVDAAPALAEIERRSDDGDVLHGRVLHGHRRKANVLPVGGGSEGVVRVLLADDDATFLESLKPLIDHQPELTVVGFAENGLHAIELADELLPDAIVIDLHMPLLDGVTAIARLRQDHANLCLIALTGDEDTDLHRAVRQAGADAVLEKGEMVGMLIDRLTRARVRTSG
jgi:CheY-like chemotaxis protein